MATYGSIRMRLSKLCPGIDIEIVDGWISDVYVEVLGKLQWKRSEAEIVIQAPASYTDGTVAVTQGSVSIVGTGTAWSAGMNGRIMRVSNHEDYYQVTFLSATTATLDRPYENASETAASYRVDQSVFVLPKLARIVRGVFPLHDRERPLDFVTPSDMHRISPQRNDYGVPRYYSSYWDSASDPPRLQIDLHPIAQSPNDQGITPSFAVDCIFDAAALDPTQTSASLLPWVTDGLLIEGVQAKAKRYGLPGPDGVRHTDLAAAAAHLAEFARLMQDAKQNNALQRGAQPVRMAPEYQFRSGPAKAPRPYSKNFDQLVGDD